MPWKWYTLLSCFCSNINLRLQPNKRLVGSGMRTLVRDGYRTKEISDPISGCHFLHRDENAAAAFSFCDPSTVVTKYLYLTQYGPAVVSKTVDPILSLRSHGLTYEIELFFWTSKLNRANCIYGTKFTGKAQLLSHTQTYRGSSPSSLCIGF